MRRIISGHGNDGLPGADIEFGKYWMLKPASGDNYKAGHSKMSIKGKDFLNLVGTHENK
jgi:hypothetical protein